MDKISPNPNQSLLIADYKDAIQDERKASIQLEEARNEVRKIVEQLGETIPKDGTTLSDSQVEFVWRKKTRNKFDRNKFKIDILSNESLSQELEDGKRFLQQKLLDLCQPRKIKEWVSVWNRA